MSSWRSGEPADGQKSSWKKKTAQSAPAPAAGKYWASGNGRKPLISGNLVRLFVALATLLATTVGMVVYLLNTNISTPLVSIAAIDYQHPWAPNAWALEDQQRLQALRESSQFQVTAKQERGEETWQHLIQSELEKVTPGGPGGSLVPALWGYRTLILHLSAHGVLNSAAQPCLLFTSADSLDESTWVPLSQVLSAIGDHPTVISHQARVLVVLDSGKQPPDARCGLIATGFTEAARETIQALPYNNFAVLLACAEDECAWVAPEMGGSVFGVMVASGLQGSADAIAGNGDALVTVQELARFVGATVDGYVREHRGRGQTPNLVWSGDDQTNDFQLCYQSRYASSPAASYQPNSRIERMTQAWQTLAEWNRQAPTYLAWPRAQAAGRLARAEQLLWAGAGYVSQFDAELNAARQIIAGPIRSPWPRVICGGSLAFLNRVHGIDATQELHAAGLDPVQAASAPPPDPATAAGGGAKPASADAAAGSSPDEAAATSEAPSPAVELTPGQRITAWLTFEPGKSETPPPVRPELPPRPLAISFLTRWLAGNVQAVSPPVMERVVDWLGPIVDGRNVTREEALLRTIHEHLQLTSGWKLAIQDRLGQLWMQYLQAAEACELSMALVDPRGTRALQGESANLAQQLQLVRDRILGCETERDASDCANDLIALQVSAQHLLQLRDRLERGWRLRDEVASELPTLAQWLGSPICGQQSLVSAQSGWDLSGQLSQQLQQLQAQLVSGQIPEQGELDTIDGALEQLAAAYRESLHEVFESSAKGQRQQLSNLMLSLGMRPNIYRGYPLAGRSELHQGLNKRYGDLQNVYSVDKLGSYFALGSTGQPQSPAIWRMNDLPQSPADTFSPVLFTETVTNQPLTAVLSAAASPRQRWAALGGELRARWRQLPLQIAERCGASLAAMESSDETSLTTAGEAMLTAEYQAHLIAWLIPSDRLNVLPDPTQQAQEVCNAQFALWQARRGLNDFWKTPLLPQAAGTLFMLGSANDWQAAVPSPVRGLVQLFEQTRQAATDLAHSWQAVWQNIQVGKPPENVWQADLSLAAFPSGRAWISLGLDGEAAQAVAFENQRFQLEQGTGSRGSASSHFAMPVSALPEGNHQLRAWFRGHTAAAPIHIAPQQPPVRLAWQAEAPGRTTIRVGAEPKPARIIFVLDCSNSLRPERMTLAKDTLVDLIREIEKNNTASEIAVALFGHRVDYLSSEADRYSQWNPQAPPEIHPYNDVEFVQPLAAPTPQLVQNLEATLQPLKKFGRTPLYESIRQAAGLLLQSRGGFTGELRIVVITDGDDNVFPYDAAALNDTARGRLKVPTEFLHSEDDVVRALQDEIRLDFVTFNFQQAQGKDRLAGLVAKLNQGSRPAGLLTADDKDLAEKLRKSISGTYSTKNLATNVTIGSRVRIAEEQPIPADQLTGRLNEFEVQIDDTAERKTVALRGGETIELQYRRTEGLRFLPYDEGDQHSLQGDIRFAGQPYQAMMLTGIPRSVPQVRLCLQSQDSFVQSLRPNQFLLELQRTKPGQDSSQGERIAWTSDGLWENHHRSPVLRVTIKDLPDLQRDRLECRLWLPGPHRAEPTEAVPISRLKEQPVQLVPGVSVSAATEREAGGLRVTLTEIREPTAPLVHWQVSPTADKSVEHKVYRTEVVHDYFFSDPLILSQIEVIATPLPPAPDDAWQATPWIPVPKWIGL